jgi:hypothetical protein
MAGQRPQPPRHCATAAPTGDIGAFDASSHLSIVGRIKVIRSGAIDHPKEVGTDRVASRGRRGRRAQRLIPNGVRR